MFRPLDQEISSEESAQCAAVQAWRQLQQAWIEPDRITVLKYKTKSQVYRLEGVGTAGRAVIAKKCPLPTARVERLIYTQFLPLAPVPALQFYGFLEEAGGRFAWLFLEEAAGQEYLPSSAEHRALAGQWLGTIHRAALGADFRALLPDLGPGHYLECLRAAYAKLREHIDNPALRSGDAALLEASARQCDVVEAHWGELEECCDRMPRVVAHDDFVAKNVRFCQGPAGPALLVFDWEHAGWGVPAIDLAAVGERTVSPDLGAYTAVLSRDFPDLTIQDVQRWEMCGKILRLIDAIYWIGFRLVFESYDWLERPLSTLKIYRARMDEALRAANWVS
jgi:hypothetical protein